MRHSSDSPGPIRVVGPRRAKTGHKGRAPTSSIPAKRTFRNNIRTNADRRASPADRTSIISTPPSYCGICGSFERNCGGGSHGRVAAPA
jgi:hypothetical protein